MKNQVFKYISQHCSTQPEEVDRLIISAFLTINKLVVKNNSFLKGFVIQSKNKSESDKLYNFIRVIENEIGEFGIEELIEIFEFVISPADRIINGAIYTPAYIREYITKQTFQAKKHQISKIKVADISCGCGGFLYNIVKEIRERTKKKFSEIFKKHIFGLDIQSYSITRSKLLLSVFALMEGEDRKKFHFNLFVGDALTFNWDKNLKKFSGFDIVVGNPPYVCSRHLANGIKQDIMKWSVCSSGHPDLYIPFFQIGIENLNANGILGFITMNSFFKSLNGRGLREYFLENKYDFRIIDFGTEKIFRTRHTYTCICFIEKKESINIKYLRPLNSFVLPLKLSVFSHIKYSNLDSKVGWNLQQHDAISKIESTGIPLGKLFQTRNGIATLKNDIFIFTPVNIDQQHYYLQNGSIYPIEREFCRDIVNPNKLGKTDNLEGLKEKILFPYDDKSKPHLLDEIFLQRNYPNAYRYLNNKRKILAQRDKGKGEYENWFAFGRSQSLEKVKHKMFFPHIADRIPNYTICSDENLLFYNGMALIGQSKSELEVIRKIMESRLFWFYITNSSKPYASGYYSLSSTYIKNFGVCELALDEIDYLINEQDRHQLDLFIEKKYGIELEFS